MDINKLQDCLRVNIGDITFKEAYEKTKRILNITVSPVDSFGIPQLLNYLTAPNVVRHL
jgi:predicted acylesterase/phospholipase RssA